MTEAEVERLVVRLTGDGSSFQRMMAQAEQSSKQAADAVAKAGAKIEAIAGNVKSFGATALGFLGSLGLATSLRGALDQYAQMEAGQIRLNAAITAGGHDAAETARRYEAVARTITSTTLVTRGQVMALFQQAEAQQLSGDKAEEAVKYAVALAGATGQSAEGMMRVAINIAKGHPEFAKRILGLREMHNGQELLDAVNKRLNAGMEIQRALFDSTSGRIERLGRGFKSIGMELGGVIAKAILPFMEFLQQAIDVVKAADEQTKRIIVTVVGLTMALLAAGPAFRVVMTILSPVAAIVRAVAAMVLLTAQIILNAAMWVLWKIAVIAATVVLAVWKGSMLLASGIMAVFNGSMLASSAAMGLWTIAAGVAKVATWLWNAALTVMNVLLAPAAVLGFVIALAAFVAVGTVLVGVVAGIGASLMVVWEAFKFLPEALGGISRITGAMSEWKGIIMDVIRTARTNLPMAWELLKAGFALVVAQVKDMWPPLWAFLRDGFGVLIDRMSEAFRIAFERIHYQALIAWNPFISDEEYRRGLRTFEQAQQRNIQVMERQFRDRMRVLNEALAANDGPAVIAARAEVDRIRGLINQAAQAGQEGGDRLGAGLANGVKKGQEKIEAALARTAEALTRMQNYVDAWREGGNNWAGEQREAQGRRDQGFAARREREDREGQRRRQERMQRDRERAARGPGPAIDWEHIHDPLVPAARDPRLEPGGAWAPPPEDPAQRRWDQFRRMNPGAPPRVPENMRRLMELDDAQLERLRRLRAEDPFAPQDELIDRILGQQRAAAAPAGDAIAAINQEWEAAGGGGGGGGMRGMLAMAARMAVGSVPVPAQPPAPAQPQSPQWGPAGPPPGYVPPTLSSSIADVFNSSFTAPAAPAPYPAPPVLTPPRQSDRDLLERIARATERSADRLSEMPAAAGLES